MAQALVLALVGMLAAVLNRLSGGALHAWIPWFTRRLLEIAAMRSPYDQRERLAEEWESHINEVSGDLGKIAFAWGCVSAAQKIAFARVRFAPRLEQQDQERQSFSKMQTSTQSSENCVMHGIPVALLSEDRNPLTNLQDCLRATNLGREVFSHVGLPTSGTDIIIRQLQESRAEVVIVDVRSQSVQPRPPCHRTHPRHHSNRYFR